MLTGITEGKKPARHTGEGNLPQYIANIRNAITTILFIGKK
jgi:hypothetical protein